MFDDFNPLVDSDRQTYASSPSAVSSALDKASTTISRLISPICAKTMRPLRLTTAV
ncbi:MAG: hypothetical protein D6698_10665 [Gammaproteobacteria bacterium]|nr:MAG: hypothetical protein D6698_10665 [Gammaproteobacteria bacterium]